MSDHESSAELGRLHQIYDELTGLSPLGATSLVRRAKAIVADHINAVAGVTVYVRCPGDGGGHDRPIPKADVPPSSPKHDEVLRLPGAYTEVRSEDRRRSIMLDPEEALATQLADFYSGRLDSFEVRYPKSKISSLAVSAHEQAIRLLRDRMHLISVVTVAETSPQATIDSLKSLAYVLETRLRQKSMPSAAEFPAISPLGRDICTPIGVEAGATRWLNNGMKLEQQFRDVFRCIDEDACCENQAYTKHGDWGWRQVWEDTGNSSSPPPTTPPPFEQYSWTNRCAVFGSAMGTVSSDWGWRTINGQLDFHAGMDIAVPVGTVVHSAADGVVVWINRTSPGGETGVIVQTGDEIRQYWHVDPALTLRVGHVINAGTIIGVTAVYPRPHLHFARYRPPGGDWQNKADSNSLSPCP